MIQHMKYPDQVMMCFTVNMAAMMVCKEFVYYGGQLQNFIHGYGYLTKSKLIEPPQM